MSYSSSDQNVRIKVTGINFKNTGLTTLYTVPAGKKFYFLDAVLECASVNVVGATNPRFYIGLSPGYNEWISNGSVPATYLDTAGKFTNLSNQIFGNRVFNGGDVLKINVTTAIAGTALTCDLTLIGYLL